MAQFRDVVTGMLAEDLGAGDVTPEMSQTQATTLGRKNEHRVT